nr:retrotransposable element Tf2 [Tanacetum cinerariifolium]
KKLVTIQNAIVVALSGPAGDAIRCNDEGTSKGTQPQSTGMTKIEFPKFGGDDVRGWLYKCEQFFEIDHVLDPHKEAIMQRFGSPYDDPMGDIKNLRHTAGLQNDVEMAVRMFRPKTLAEVYHLSKVQEAAIKVNKQKYRPPLLPAPRGQVFNLEVVADPVHDYSNDSVIDHDEEVVHEEVTGEVIEFTPQIFMNALNGVESFQTLRVTGHVGKQDLHILINTRLTSKNMCKKFAWKIHGEEFVVDAMLLPLGGCNMVLGVQWLSTLGDIKINFQELGMEFKYQGRKVALRGTRKSCLQWMKGSKDLAQSAQLSSMVLCVYPSTALNMVSANLTEGIPTLIARLLTHFHDVFAIPTSLPPMREYDHKIVLKKGTEPIFSRPYRHPPAQKDAIEIMVKELLESGVIRPSQSPFSSPIVMLRGFLGLTGYYMRFIKGYALISQPLTKLLKKNAFVWTKEAQSAFVHLKEAMVNAHVLKLPDFNEPFIVETDASGEGIENGAADALSGVDTGSQLLSMVLTSINTDLLPQIVATWSSDPSLITLISNLQAGKPCSKHYSWSNQQLTRKGKLVYTKNSGILLLEENEEASQEVCFNVCQRSKPDLSAYPGLLQPLPIPTLLWSEISMDFVKGLSNSGGKTIIMVVVDKLSKYSHFMALSHPFTAIQVAQLFLDNVYKLHDLPKIIVSDRNKIFISLFWKELFKMLQVSLHFSTAYHPQSDGETEVVNRCLECYLRCMTGEKPKEWAKWLSLVEYWYNTNFHTSINTTPFEAVYGQPHTSPILYSPGQSKVDSVDRSLAAKETIRQMLQFHLERAQSRLKAITDLHRTSSTLAAEVGIMAAVTVPFVTFFVTPTPERKSDGRTDFIFGPNLRTRHPAERFVISSDSSHHSSTNAADNEVTSIIRSPAPPPPVMTTAIATTAIASVTSALVLGVGTELARRGLFRDSASLSTAEADIAGPSQPTGAEVSADTFYVSQDMDSKTLQQVYVPQWNVINDFSLDDLELSLKEAEAAKAIRLRSQVVTIEATKAARVNELNSLKERTTALEGQLSCDELSIKAASLEYKKDKLTDQVSLLETTCFGLRDQVAGLDAELMRMAFHRDEEIYPRFLTTIAGRRWILGRGLRLVVMRCLQSLEYLDALEGSIGRAIDKGMQDGLAAGIDHGKAERGLVDVDAFNSSAEANYVFVVNALRSAAETPKASRLQPLHEQLMLPIHRTEGQVVIGETFLSFSLDVVHACANTSGVLAAIAATTALSTTFVQANSVLPVPASDYKVVDTKPQAEAFSSPDIIFEKETLETSPKHPATYSRKELSIAVPELVCSFAQCFRYFVRSLPLRAKLFAIFCMVGIIVPVHKVSWFEACVADFGVVIFFHLCLASCLADCRLFSSFFQKIKIYSKASSFCTMCISVVLKAPIGCTPYKLVYEKSCHLPIELEHKAYWALKHVNFDLKTTGDHRKLQLNELNELRDQAYENSLIYKERTKKLHDSKIKNRIFNVGDQVLLFNSRLKIFSGKLKTLWSGPFTITRRSNRRRVPNIVKPEIRTIEDVVPMADRTMEELLQAHTKGYGEAIVILEILAENFEIKTNLLQMTSTLKYMDVPNDAIKLMLFPYSLEGAARIWYEKEPPNSILTWDDLVNKFVNQFFPPSKTTHLKNEISQFTQRFEETFGEAWERFKEILRACPHHGFLELTQIDTFYNGLNEQDQDSLNVAAGGNLLSKTTREALKIIENKSKVRYSRSKSNVSRVNMNSRDSASKTDDRIDKLADQISNLVEIVNKQVITPATAKAVEKTCVICGGDHDYDDCITTDSNQLSVCMAMATYNQVSPPNRVSSQIPPPSFCSGAKQPNQHSNCQGSTAHIQLPVVPISIPEPDVPKTQPKPKIPYPSKLNDQKLCEKATNQVEKFFQIFHDFHFDISFADALLLMPKFASTIKILLTNKDKLFELAKVPLNENCSAMLLKKLPEKLRDPDKFLIPCDFPRIDVCHALADLGASINLMPLSIWKKLSLPKLTPTRMTLELADRSITRPKGVAEDVFVKVGKFYFPTDFVVVDFKADPRVPLILGRSFLRTGRALIDVYGKEITLRVNDESITFNLNQTMKYSSTYNDNSVNRVYVIDIACEEFVQNVLDFQYNSKSNNPSLVSNLYFLRKPIVKFVRNQLSNLLRPHLLPLEKEKLLNDDPFQLPSMDLKQTEETKAKSSIEEPSELELKELPSHLEYAFLEDTDKLPVIIAKDLKDVKKEALIKVLKSHKRAIAWEISDIKVEVFMDDFLVFGDSFSSCLSNLDKMLKRCEDTNLVLNWEKCHFMCKEGIVLRHKISKSGIEVDKAKVDVIAKLPHPTHPTTVKGVGSFLGHAVSRVMIKYGVTHRLATAYHPQTSGQVEVSNRGLKRILERTVRENHASWSEKLDDALWAFRTAFKTPIDCGCHGKLQLNELNKLRDQAYENYLIYKERTKKLHDSKIKNRIFNVGDQVLLFNSRLKIFSEKLKTSWSGPFTITQVFSYGTLELSQPNGPNFKVNGHRVKHYFGRDIPSKVVPNLYTFPMDN